MKLFTVITLLLTLFFVPAYAEELQSDPYDPVLGSMNSVETILFRTNSNEMITIKIGDMITFDLACTTVQEMYNSTFKTSCYYAEYSQPLLWGKIIKIERIPYALTFTIEMSLVSFNEGVAFVAWNIIRITEINRIFQHIPLNE